VDKSDSKNKVCEMQGNGDGGQDILDDEL